MIVKVALVTLGLVLAVATLPHNLDWKYGKAPKNALEANLRAYACEISHIQYYRPLALFNPYLLTRM